MTVSDRIEINPSIMEGKPVLLGTRVPLELVLRKLDEGATDADLLSAYPRLTREDLSSARDLLAICGRFSVAALAIFGSALRDDFRPESDIDLLVDFKSGARIGFLALSRLARELERFFRRRVDLVPRRSLKQSLRPAIEDNAKVLYAA